MRPKTRKPFLQRSRLEIITCLLSNAYNGSRKTRLIYKCNLSVSLFNKYVTHIIDGGLIKKHIEEKGVEIYLITDKGKAFLKDYEKIKKILEKMNL